MKKILLTLLGIFAFGMNWNGVIKDHREKKYK